MLKDVISRLVETPELSTYNLISEVDEYYTNLVSDFQNEVASGSNGPVSLQFGETGIRTLIPFEMLNIFISTHQIVSANYWSHEGVEHNNHIVLILWSSDPLVITDAGKWEFFNGTSKVAEVIQNPLCSDEVVCKFILKNPSEWIVRFNSSGNLIDSISSFAGYVRLFTQSEIEIEAVLLELSAIGLHAFKPRSKWNHSINNGCAQIEDDIIPGLVSLSIPTDFSIERSRMFRFASIAEDPFDAILRYWHIVEHMFDNLVEYLITDFVTTTPRADKFSRKVSQAITEASCAKEILVHRITSSSYNEIISFVDPSFKLKIENTASIAGTSDFKFWNSNEVNGKRVLGGLLYSFRNAVAHRRETENWFNRMLPDHENSVKGIMPLIQKVVYYAIVT
ncbi:hypothetical protein [Cohnella mopanensis]|uniref:hypothetical protein n=1 Tax=Cohnella mopanensis TaxID=2911966 RepID=UPI001EF99D57|nr:hypothetical protein [Cohnella mopanensis]